MLAVTAALAEPAAAVERTALPIATPILRAEHAAVLLPDGRLLAAGGLRGQALASVQIYEPATGAWYEAEPMQVARARHAAALLPDGSLLVCGGCGHTELASTEIYDVRANTWRSAAPMRWPRQGHTATSAAGGVIVLGGTRRGVAIAAEYYDANTDQWNVIA